MNFKIAIIENTGKDFFKSRIRLAKYLKNNGFEIERIYIKKEFQGNGFGSELFSTAINLGIKKGCNQLWLGVWEHNYKALAFYKKKGLIAFDHHVFQLGDDPQTDILMYLKF